VKGTLVTLEISAACAKSLRWTLFTTAYRRVAGGEMTVLGRSAWRWDLRDDKGRAVASGLYYLSVEVEGEARRLYRILALR